VGGFHGKRAVKAGQKSKRCYWSSVEFIICSSQKGEGEGKRQALGRSLRKKRRKISGAANTRSKRDTGKSPQSKGEKSIEGGTDN